jgi:hypothetical protein
MMRLDRSNSQPDLTWASRPSASPSPLAGWLTNSNNFALALFSLHSPSLALTHSLRRAGGTRGRRPRPTREQ